MHKGFNEDTACNKITLRSGSCPQIKNLGASLHTPEL